MSTLPEPDLIPPQIAPWGAGQAEIQRRAALAARQLVAERDFARARAAVASATADRDAAQVALDAAKTQQSADLARAADLHTRAAAVAAQANDSRHLLSGLIRQLAQQHAGGTSADALIGAGPDLLFALGSLDRMQNLTGNVSGIRDRAEAEADLARSLAQEEATALDAADFAPLAQRQADLESAQAALDRAVAALSDLEALAAGVPVGVLAAGLSATEASVWLSTLDTGQLSAQGWALPAAGGITDVFGPRLMRPVAGAGPFHFATDIGAGCDAPVRAATSGVVAAVGTVGGYGNWILIDHGAGVQTGYAHLATGELLVAMGDTVAAGQVIAGVGSTGVSTGCHLHFEVRVDGTRIDPQPFLAARGVTLGSAG